MKGYRRDYRVTRVARIPRHVQFSVIYRNVDTLEIAFIAPTKKLVRQVEADFHAAFAKIKASVKNG